MAAGGQQETVEDGAVRGWVTRAGLTLPVALGVLLAIGLIGNLLGPVNDRRQFSGFLFLRQDLLPALAIILMLRFTLKPVDGAPVRGRPGPIQRPWLVALALALACWAGHRWLLLGYDMTRDEQMATFDAAIFAQGRLFWPVAPAWRNMAEALNQFFILPVADRQNWVSAYLPVNAATHAALGLLGVGELASPLFTAIGALALWRIAERLWPGDIMARTVALLLYAGSSQVVIQGMTAHAMAGHLALNMVWLWLFLRGGWSHAGAITVGFLATGLHQPLFHPLFVFPILLTLPLQRRWPLTLVYGASYLAIGLFWLSWPGMIATMAGGPLASLSGTGDRISYLDRVAFMLRDLGPVSLWLMAINLLRFIVWQHLLLLPLAAAAIGLAWRRPLVRPLSAGVALHILCVGLLLAYQGHGWGYRYLHGVIGSLCLLGVEGWRMVYRHWPSSRLWAWGNAATFLLVVPAHMAMAAWLTWPYARTSGAIDALDAPVAIVDDGAVAFGADLVHNRPDLTNRPIRLLAGQLTVEQARALCLDGPVAFVDIGSMRSIRDRIDAEPGDERHFHALQAACRKVRP
ncbi:hypothetical protein J3E64_002564 [Sphingobium sp. OAS761]|uniref:hypothetical protein n=1 Tax=Sphingobium sp. OAS761 TaxID=2817901 RepID=UPI00209FC41F|nr:hypothetical protein [Sphingobium sp. OAS761]MCP1470871.1 hypothetical protein [Sphingobium sp. OAS761]